VNNELERIWRKTAVSCFEVPIARLLARTNEIHKNDKARWPLSVPRLQPENCYPVCTQYVAATHCIVLIALAPSLTLV